MIPAGAELDQFCQIHLMLEAKFGHDPLSMFVFRCCSNQEFYEFELQTYCMQKQLP